MTFRNISRISLIAALIVFSNNVHGQEAMSPSMTWQNEARKSGLSETDISMLEKNRILISNRAYKQIFSAYLSGDQPLFITSDSLLNAYHVLYEESVFRLENKMASRLPEILRFMLKNLEDTDDHLEGKPDLAARAKKRAMLVTGIAMKLMDPSFRFDDDKLNTILAKETKKIVAAKGVEMPQWLGEPDTSFMALDYSRYEPRGFYRRTEKLKQYFRAVSWLQSIPFHIDRDEELLSILMLGNSVGGNRFDNYAMQQDFELFFQVYRSFIGSGDDWDLMSAARNRLYLNLNGDDLQQRRERLLKKAERQKKKALINDQIRLPPQDVNKIAGPEFRIITAYHTPSAILFQKTTDRRRFSRDYPDGLAVPAALGSTFARRKLVDSGRHDFLKTIDSCRIYFRGKSLYLKYLNALKALVDDPEPDAPDFIKNKGWQAKTCNTVLAGWSQLRHTWALQAKQTVYYSCMTLVPEGFVEPEPEFFARMADLAEATKRLLKQTGVFEPDYTHIVRSLEKYKAIIKGVENEEEQGEDISRLPREDMNELILPFLIMEGSPSKAKKGSAADFKKKVDDIDAIVRDIEEGRINQNLERMLKACDFDLEALWNLFEKVSRRLEAIAHKQLRGVDLNRSEIDFIKDYGSAIAGIMLYGGNSYRTPKDDAPRVVDVYANPERRGYLHAGIARPRKLFVLYPWHGRPILCRGAIMPYYEFVAATRLTDASWKKRLDSGNRPEVPQWVSSVVSGGDLSKAELENNH